MDEEPLYEHRRMISRSTVVVLGAVLVPGPLAYRDDLAGIVEIWPALLGLLVLPVWHWFMVGRHVDRHVRVDSRGLWVDGELVVRPEEVVGLGTTVDKFWSFHMDELESLTEGRRTVRGGIWSQKAWVNVIESPGFDRPAAVTRRKDLARGSWWNGVIVQSEQWLHEGYRDAWLIGSSRYRELFEALFAIAPHAQLPQGRPPGARRGHQGRVTSAMPAARPGR